MQKALIMIMMVLMCSPAWGFGWSSAGGGKRINLTVSGWAAQGAWSASTTYAANDVVTHNGSTWTAIQGGVNHEPADESLFWLKSIAKGDAATVSAGTVTPLEHGQSPTVTNAGTTGAAVFNFGIPAGAPGAAGSNGKTVLTTSGVPASGTGVDGDYAYAPDTYTMYGPKASGAWPAGTIIKGVDGAGFTSGADGSYGWLTDSNTSTYTECVAGKYGINFVGGVLYQCSNGTNSAFAVGGGTWGSITGTLSAQADLQAALDAISAGGITISTGTPTTAGAAYLNDSTHVLTVASATGYTQFTGSFTAWDTTPDAFAFTDETDIAISTAKTSNAITVAGTNYPAAISVTGDTGYGYSKNSAACTATSGTVVAGDTVAVCVTSSSSNSTATTATITIGGVSDTYSVTTAAGGAATYTDDFNRSNGGLGSNWTTVSNESAPQIVSNVVKGTSAARFGAYYSAQSFDNDQYSQVYVSTVSNAANAIVRASSSAETYYYFGVGTGSSFVLYKRVAGTATQLCTGNSYGTASSAVTIKLSVSGTTLTPYINGVAQTTCTDSSIASGSPGIYLYSDVPAIDNWEGGNL